ncbi:MBL fold metallo-hydrolase [Alloprevotella sp. oral taxon 473]|uniref:MBL fold metallo-hydrolase n=1 Tax=Alloprevotella sp. oral taxon 473 TaxID=712469 RepID=UPI0005C4421B|nr:MBL fold metallo-hydrolase [Alloprevotella sp. oral taxon 473]
MKLHFLGTGTSIGVPQMGCSCSVCRSEDPRDKRLRCSALLETDDHRLILIDCGPDFRTQMLRFIAEHPYTDDRSVPYSVRKMSEMSDEQARKMGLHEAPRFDYAMPRIEAVLLTHEHFDHVAGLDDLRPFSYFHSIDVWAEPNVAETIINHMGYVFGEKHYPGAPKLTMNPLEEHQSITIGDNEIVPVRVYHGKLPILGYRIGPLAYLTDMSQLGEQEWGKLEGVETLVVSALRDEPHATHQTIEEAIAFGRKVGAKRTYFIHMCHTAGKQADRDEQLPEGFRFAYDGLTIDC